ncbi:outer membrane biogenesis protein BamB [Thalassoglobus neptunius]|uniref:Outer membrane biogenesis protein BamB n=2 Tax=Thalassoglobus neptunius TaxID=1938619 RepID=A0A5C5X3V3_9PLAN|nr:outer membrane biogenesis protein BamB [Thalassoglobus neptunius]
MKMVEGHFMRIPFSVGVVVLALIVLPVRGEDWNEFRGPTGQGEVSGVSLPVEWNDSESDSENILWKQQLDGLAWSSPIVVDGKIFMTCASEESEDSLSLQLIALDAETGDEFWRRELWTHSDDVQVHKKNSHASPTPICDGEHLYAHFGPQGTACVTLDGEIVWKQKLEYKPVHGNGGSPALAEGVLVICCDGGDRQFVVGLDRASGDIRWRTERETDPKKGFSFSTPLVIEVNGQQQAVCPGSDAVFVYDPQTGEEIWRVDYPGGYSVTPRPVYGNGLVYVCTGFNKPQLLAIDPTGTGNVTETHLRWSADRAIPHSPSPVFFEDSVYVVSDKGIATCFDAESGEVVWQERLGGNFSASPIVSDRKLYFQDETGTGIVLKASREFEELSRNNIGSGERTFASYAVDGDSILLRSESHLYRIGRN